MQPYSQEGRTMARASVLPITGSDVEASDWLSLAIGFQQGKTDNFQGTRKHVGLTRLTLSMSTNSDDEDDTYLTTSSEGTLGKGHRPSRGSGSIIATKKHKDGFSENQEKRRQRVRSKLQSKRRRVATAHNLAEKRRRKNFNQKIEILQSLLPNSCKHTDKASILEEVIQHVKLLKAQIEAIAKARSQPFQMLIPEQFQFPRFTPITEMNATCMGNRPACHSQLSALHYNCNFFPFSGNYSAVPKPCALLPCQPQVLGNDCEINRVATSNLPSRPVLRSLPAVRLPNCIRLREGFPNL